MKPNASLVPCSSCGSRACRWLSDPRFHGAVRVLPRAMDVPSDCPLLVTDRLVLECLLASAMPSELDRMVCEMQTSVRMSGDSLASPVVQVRVPSRQILMEAWSARRCRIMGCLPGQAVPDWLRHAPPSALPAAPAPTPAQIVDMLAQAKPIKKVAKNAIVPIHVIEVPRLHFSLGSPVPLLDEEGQLLGAVATALRYAKEEAASTQDGKLAERLVVCGHCDTSGKQRTNYKLSQQRAQMVKALLDQNSEGWKTLAAKHGKVCDYQQILRSLYVLRDWPCDPGEVDGVKGPATLAAIKGFQQECNDRYGLELAVDGDVGPKTWAAIHRTLCGLVCETIGKEDAMAPAASAWERPVFGYPQGQGVFGCGESFQASDAGKDGLKSQENRRVEILFVPDQVTFNEPSSLDANLTPAECPAYDPEKTQRKVLPIPALPEVLEIYWSYGPDHVRLTDTSRHYVDMNVHLVTSNYAPGDRISVRIRGDNDEPLFGTQRFLMVQGQVGTNGEAVIENVFSDKSLNLEWE